MIPLPAFLSSKAFGIGAVAFLVAGYTSAVFYAGTSVGKLACATDKIEALEDARENDANTLDDAHEAELEGRENENAIREVRVVINPVGCKPDEPTRLRFIQRQAERDALASVSGSVPGTMPPSEANDGS